MCNVCLCQVQVQNSSASTSTHDRRERDRDEEKQQHLLTRKNVSSSPFILSCLLYINIFSVLFYFYIFPQFLSTFSFPFLSAPFLLYSHIYLLLLYAWRKKTLEVLQPEKSSWSDALLNWQCQLTFDIVPTSNHEFFK